MVEGEAGAVAVRPVPDDGVADGREVHADLVGAAGLEPHGQEGGGLGIGVPVLDLVVGGRGATVRGDGLQGGTLGIPADGRLDPARGLGHRARDQRGVLPLDVVGRDHGAEAFMGLLGPGDHEEARGAPVEAVDDARTGRVRADADESGVEGQQAVDEGRLVRSPSRDGRPGRRACPPRRGDRRRGRGTPRLRHRPRPRARSTARGRPRRRRRRPPGGRDGAQPARRPARRRPRPGRGRSPGYSPPRPPPDGRGAGRPRPSAAVEPSRRRAPGPPPPPPPR